MSGTHRLYIDFDSSQTAKQLMRELQKQGLHGWHIDYIAEVKPPDQYVIKSIYNKAGRIVGYKRIYTP